LSFSNISVNNTINISLNNIEICLDVKIFLSNNIAQGRTFDKIPIDDINIFITTEMNKFKLNESIIHNFVYNYDKKCNTSYPNSIWAWILNNIVVIVIIMIIVIFIMIKVARNGK